MKTLFPATSYRLLLLVLLHAAALTTQAQTGGSVGIGTNTPNASAVLDLTATNKGLLVPRLDSAARVRIAQPATGLLVFQTSPRQGFYYYAGTAAGWRYLPDQTRAGDNLGSHAATRALDLGANALVGSGADLGSAVGVGVRADGGLNIGQNSAGNNVFLGYQAGQANTTGLFNQFSGFGSGFSNTNGSYNQFSGYLSGYSNTQGGQNLFSGFGSGYGNTTGNYNQFIGVESGRNNATGYQNQFSGFQSGYSNSYGSLNQFDGYRSGTSNTTGSVNLFCGYQSGYFNTTGSYNLAFGYNAGPTTGNLTNAGAIGNQAVVSQSNSLVLGGTGFFAVQVGIGTTAPVAQLEVQLPTTSATASLKLEHRGSNLIVRPLSGGNSASIVENTAGNLLLNPSNGNVGIGTVAPGYKLDVAGTIRGNNVSPSDVRFKRQVRPLTGALAGALALHGVRYRWNALGVAHGGVAGAEQLGLLAQEVEKIYPELVSTDAQGYKAVNYAQLTPVLLEAIRELAAEAETQRTRATQAEATLSSFEQRLRALEAAAAQAAAH